MLELTAWKPPIDTNSHRQASEIVTDSRDNLYADPGDTAVPGPATDAAADPVTGTGLFRFDESVARVFPDMIKRSVPGYSTIGSMT